jgi:hypothetical protein
MEAASSRFRRTQSGWKPLLHIRDGNKKPAAG